jgi:SWI/SNF-related matrix-associated actin-dependent regulator of chromatin subfamily A member 5
VRVDKHGLTVLQNAVEEKVLERAAQKLRLDQLVIQQGRAAPPKNQTSKDEILEMIQHGAEKIINAKDSMSLDDDIDDIIKKGEERTQALNEKYSSLNIHDLANFTSDTAVQQWEGEQFGKAKKIGALWIEPTKRERKTNYSVDNYYRDTMNGPRRAGPSKAPQPPSAKRSDWQFFPPRFHELQKKETYAYRKDQNYIVPLGMEKGKTPEQLEAERKAEQDLIDNGPLAF